MRAALLFLLAVAVSATAIAKPEPAPADPNGAATIIAYKRDPLPLFDETGSKINDVPVKSMPKANSSEARAVGSKLGFVAIRYDGKQVWLRLSTVDFVGVLPSAKCDSLSISTALKEEDGVERSLGLGCSKVAGK